MSASYRPVVCIAYGDRGREWLLGVLAACRQLPTLQKMLELGVFQCWSIGSTDKTSAKGLEALGYDSSASALRALVDRGLQQGLALELPGLGFHEIIVLERWSLYDETSADRMQVRTAFEQARTVGGGGATFDLKWIGLADGVWPGPSLADSDQQRARTLLQTDHAQDRTLFIDRTSVAGGVIAAPVADHCFQQLAVAALSGDLLFPRPSAGGHGRSAALDAPSRSGYCIPISIMGLAHDRSRFEEGRVQGLVRFLGKRLSPDASASVLELVRSVPDLPDVASRQLEEKSHGGRSSAFSERQEREEAVSALMLRALALQDPHTAHAAVRETLRVATARANQLREPDSPHTQTSTGLRGVLAGSVLQGDAANRISDAGFWLIPVVGISILALAWFIVRGRAGAPPATFPADSQPSDGSRLRQLSSEWISLCETLEATLRSFERMLDAGRASHSAHSTWTRNSSWYEWKLTNAPSGEDLAPWDARSYSDLAGECAYRATRRAGEDVFDDAVRAVASASIQRSPELPARQLGAALTGPAADPVRHAVRELPLLANAGAPLRMQEALWLTSSLIQDQDALESLDVVANRTLTNILRIEDDSHTYRIVFGDPVLWTDLRSLSFLKTAA